MRKFKINLAIVALVLGSTVAFATTTKQLDPTHYKDPTNGMWKVIDAEEGVEEGQYSCNGLTGLCTGYFSIENPSDQALPESNARPGTYTIN